MTVSALRCPRCDRVEDDPVPGRGCVTCEATGHAVNLSTVPDRDAIAHLFSSDDLARRPFTLWRYAEALGLPESDAVTLGEGGTPLVPAPRLADELGVREIWIKDESRNPTWSFKDRAASLAATHARRSGSRGMVAASTGNAAAATAAYARRAGLPAVVLVAVSPPMSPSMEAFVRGFRPMLVAAPTKSGRWGLMRHVVESLGFFPNSNFANPPLGNTPWAIDGYMTLGFEIWEQLGRRAPSSIVLPIAYGDAAYGIYKAFEELRALELAAMPAIGAGEVYGSLTAAMADGSDAPAPMTIDRDTVASSIATSQGTYQALSAMRGSGGWVQQVSDGEILDAQRLLVETVGLFVEPTAAAGLAALRLRIAHEGISSRETVVLVSTSSGLKGATSDAGAEIPVVDSPDALEELLSQRGEGGRP